MRAHLGCQAICGSGAESLYFAPETREAEVHRLRLRSGAPAPAQKQRAASYYLPPYTLSKNFSFSSCLSQLESIISSALTDATLGFCSLTYLSTVLVPSRVGYGFLSN